MRSLSRSVCPSSTRVTTNLKKLGYLLLELNKDEESSFSSCCCTAPFSTSLEGVQLSVACSGNNEAPLLYPSDGSRCTAKRSTHTSNIVYLNFLFNRMVQCFPV